MKCRADWMPGRRTAPAVGEQDLAFKGSTGVKKVMTVVHICTILEQRIPLRGLKDNCSQQDL